MINRYLLWLIGHEANSVLSCIKFHSPLPTNKLETLDLLSLNDEKPLKKLNAFGLIKIDYIKNKLYSIRLLDENPKLNLKELCIGVIEAGYAIKEFKNKPWFKIFQEFNQYDLSWSVSGESVYKISLGTINKHSTILINDKSIMTGEDQYQSLVHYEKPFDPSFDYYIGESNNLSEKLTLIEVTSIESNITDYEEWKNIDVEKWNSKHMSDYIYYLYQQKFGERPPYSSNSLKRSGISGAASSLYLKLPVSMRSKNANESYIQFIEWIMNHKFYKPIINHFTSAKIMEHYVVEKTKYNKTTQIDPFNLS